MADSPHARRQAVVLTAIPTEYQAVRAHLTDLGEVRHSQGTIYEYGKFLCPDGGSWSVAIVEIGPGNSAAALETERAVRHFNPSVLLFVGIAGGLKDVRLCDVVAATKVYGYESGKSKRTFQPRPDVGQSSYSMVQCARAERRKAKWLSRLNDGPSTTSPQVHVAPIAAGEKVIASRRSPIHRFLRNAYGDAVAVEMEGRGFLQAAHANRDVTSLIVRGISDLLNGKSEADTAGYQDLAARAASAFAFEVLANLDSHSADTTGQYVLVFSATIDEVDKARAEAIVSHLCDVAKDPHLSLIRIEEGSVKLVLEGSRGGFARIEALIETGELSELLGLNVTGVFWETPLSEPDALHDRMEGIIGGALPEAKVATMALITIREGSGSVGDHNASVSFEGQGEFPIKVNDPFSEEEEARLAWYFEEHLRFPFTRQVDARAAADSIRTYGEDLFTQVFFGEAYTQYRMALQAGPDTMRVEIAGSPQFHQLHWEALQDPALAQPLALQIPMVRKNLAPGPIRANVRSSPTINLLVVTARPRGAQDVGYRTISRPLVEALRQTSLRVQVEILRPGTYEALFNHLEEVRDRHGVGFYHLIHLDVHGSLLSYDQYQEDRELDRAVFQGRYGRDEIEEYSGLKAYLFLEGTQEGLADPVEATELAGLLINHQIPVAILNACQSGKQVGATETSLGSRLMQAGMQMVLAMGYSVTVSAAELMMGSLYQQLFGGSDLSSAIRRSRQELYNRKERRVYFNQTIQLEDWLLPVVYQNQEVRLGVRDLTPEEQGPYYQRQAEQYQVSQPNFGFVGRDLDILEIEKRVLSRRNLLLLRGMGGCGKTTLLHHLAAWWQTTRFVERVFYFGYDERAWTRQAIMDAMARKLLSPVEYLTFQPMGLDAQQAMLAERLRGERQLLILDNLESITGDSLAIPNTLSAEEQAALRSFLAALAGGRTLVLLGSRSGEESLAPGTFSDNIYELSGLDPEAASTLADRILGRQSSTRYGESREFQRLVEILDGYPLALEVVLSNLARQTPAEVLEALEAGDVDLDAGDAQDKTQSILRCIDYSHSNLSPGAQGLLACLAPFSSVINTEFLPQYTERLREQPALANLPFERWEEVLKEASSWGLVSAHTQVSGFLVLQPIFAYFLRSRLQGQGDLSEAVETAFREHYDRIGGLLNRALVSNEAGEKRLGQTLVELEYENLATALRLALITQVSILNPFEALSKYLDISQDHRRGLELGEMVSSGLERYSAAALEGELGLQLARVLNRFATHQSHLRQYAASEASYLKALDLIVRLKTDDEQIGRRVTGSINHNLGILAQQQRQWPQAERYYQEALTIKVELDDRFSQASTHHQLGMVARGQRQWREAERHYQQALAIFVEFNDRYEQAGTYHHLGIVAQEQGQWPQAERHYEQALAIFVEFNDRYEQAGTYHNLGIVAQERRQWPQAEQYYQQALAIKVEFNDRYEQAKTYHHLGIVAQEQGRWPQAEQYYQQALEILVEFNDRYEQAKSYHQLGFVAQEQRQWPQAEQYYQQALAIFVEFSDPYYQAGTYNQLGIVAREQSQWAQAEQYHRQALAIFVESSDRYYQALTYGNLGIVAQEQRQWPQAERYYQAALAIFVESNDEHSLGITLRRLAELWKQGGDPGLPASVASVLGIDRGQAEELLRAALPDE